VKRVLIALTLGLVVALGFVPHVAHLTDRLAPTLVAQEDPVKITVYITRTGEKYHRDGCRYLSRSKSPRPSRTPSRTAMDLAACASRPADRTQGVLAQPPASV
jgi:hypothetical protein